MKSHPLPAGFAFLIIAICLACSTVSKDRIILEDRFFKYEIDNTGKNLSFIDKQSGTSYLDSAARSSCAYIMRGGKQYYTSAVRRKNNGIRLEFGESGATADLSVSKAKDHLTLKVTSAEGDIESLTFLNIPLSLEGMPYETFAACALSMNLFTHVRLIPALQNNLWATCYKKFGIKGAEVTILGLPQEKILPVIRDVMSHAPDVPHSDKGGAWAMMNKEGYGSYLMNFGMLTEESVDEWIAMCRSLGFNQVDNHGGSDFFKFGDFELNKDKWPGGWDSFKRINDRLHAAGISSIFHTYAFFLDKNCSYVTPVPSEDLGYASAFTLDGPVDEKSTEITVKESTAGISTVTGFHVENSVSLRIGKEIIVFSDVTRTPPYKFTGCKRGANGTTASAHNAGDRVYHLSERFGRFVPGPETPLFDEVARKTAEIVNQCGFDGIYFDAIDGSSVLGGEDNFWYYGTKFIFAVANNLEKPVGMEMSSMSHHWWHFRSRWQAWDRPVRGYKRFVDIHLASLKSPGLFLPSKIRPNEWEHGIWRGHAPLIDKYSAMDNSGFYLPLHLGWWGNSVWNPPQAEPTFPDDVEYLCCKMIGNNAGLAMLGGADEKTLNTFPAYRRLTGIIRMYEELRLADYFSETIKKQLRQPGREFTLFKEENGKWNFKPVTYKKHKIQGTDHPSASWTVDNEFGDQPLKLRIEPLMSVRPFNDPSAITIADFSRQGEFSSGLSADGFEGGLARSGERIENMTTGAFTARSTEVSPGEGSWLMIGKKFDPLLDLSKNQALGVWVKGDGNGEIISFRVESPQNISSGARGDHFVKVDFTGWKYFELVEVESSEFSNYIWPDDSQFYVYNSYMHTVRFGSIDKLQLWYNNLPAGKDVSCLIGPVRALPMVQVNVENPSVTLGGEKIIFPVEMEPGMYLEFRSENDCKLYRPKGEFISDVVPEGNVPVMKEGENRISYSCDHSGMISPRVQVTIICEGKPL